MGMKFISYLLKKVKSRPRIFFILLMAIVCLVSIKVHEYVLPLPAENWINSNLMKIRLKNPDHFSFAVFSNSKDSITIFENLLKQVDHDSDIAFVLELGDAVLKGKTPYYRQFINKIETNLGIPFLTVIGDQELTGDGRKLYRKIFGPFYYSFTAGRQFFIVMDNIHKKGIGPDQMTWLIKELEKAQRYSNRIIFLHRPLYEPHTAEKGAFLTGNYSQELFDLFSKYNVTHIFASNTEGFFQGVVKGIHYTVTGGTGSSHDSTGGKYIFSHFLKVNVAQDDIRVEIKEINSAGLIYSHPFRYRIMTCTGNILRFHWEELALFFILLLCMIFFVHDRKKSPGIN